ncbi:hypothetical protein HH1059_02040 [Halorhodospira halochloris]|uniref:Nucleotidyltransferase n=2 Tax=Halorhodospira halochloris TaxID=1052 RepID=A0A0X8X790_HALHR|nr:hypothetical protein HH1059_02040 [Halorhodospira halochloris]
MRVSLIREAARLMAEEGIKDYFTAKRKAAQRLGAADTHNLPKNQEIQDALIEYQEVFGGAEHLAQLHELRREAVKAMELFERFRPRLVGPVLLGTADSSSGVQLHLFADTPETVLFFLMDRGIPFDPDERRLRFGKDGWAVLPVFRFMAGNTEVELTVFNENGLREAPRSEVHGRPMERASLNEVRSMIDGAEV